MHRPGTAGRDQGEGRGIVAAFDAEPLDRMQEVLFKQADHAGSCILDREAERLGKLGFDRSAGKRAVEIDGATGQRAGAQAPQHELRVCNGGVLASEPISGRTGPRTGALRTDMQEARIVDPGDGAATGANRVDFDRRRGEVIAVDHQLIRHRHIAARHHHDIATRAADLHGDQVGLLTGARAALERTDAGRRTG